jgi:hypothetical protein
LSRAEWEKSRVQREAGSSSQGYLAVTPGPEERSKQSNAQRTVRMSLYLSFYQVWTAASSPDERSDIRDHVSAASNWRTAFRIQPTFHGKLSCAATRRFLSITPSRFARPSYARGDRLGYRFAHPGYACSLVANKCVAMHSRVWRCTVAGPVAGSYRSSWPRMCDAVHTSIAGKTIESMPECAREGEQSNGCHPEREFE